ncbi:MAG: hypothetical protein ACXWEN_04665, partial [Actinomycetota bacterium]
EAIVVGEAKWARHVDGPALVRALRKKAGSLPRVREDVRFAVCARETVEGDPRLRTGSVSVGERNATHPPATIATTTTAAIAIMDERWPRARFTGP